MERISVIHGTYPIVLVAPHAYPGDDYNTDIIVEAMAKRINASAIINNGWQKSDKLDIAKEQANCNNIDHLVDVVQDEFLLPFVRLVRRACKYHKRCLVVLIHGVSNYVRKMAADPHLDMILGYGEGAPSSSLSCTYGIKDYVLYNLSKSNICVYEGKAKGRYSGFAKTNLNQYWRKHVVDPSVESFQLEIVRELRDDRTISVLTAEYISEAIQDALDNRFWKKPTGFKAKQI